MALELEIVNAMKLIDAQTYARSTEEQLELASDFTKPVYSFANPGTGKSHTIVRGLIMAQTYHRVPGAKINAMSFTREATNELSARYAAACKSCRIRPTVTFNTFHKICRQILSDKYGNFEIMAGYDWDADLKTLGAYMEKCGLVNDDMYYMKNVLKAISDLNNRLCWDPANIITKSVFKSLRMPVEVFQQLRKNMFIRGIIRHKITQGEIPIHALYVLATDKALQQKYREKYSIMVVDEFQDMTKLYLVILSMISKNLVVVGDIKQQIYGFNGACPEIVREFQKMYPQAIAKDLTQSFRCRNEIADFATSLYWPNDHKVEAFSGIGDGGTVKIFKDNEFNLKLAVSKIKTEQDKEGRTKFRTTMFLFRNNFSITPVAEELYKQDVLFRVKTFYKVMDYPIFKELCLLANCALRPTDAKAQWEAIQLFPEFRKYNDPDKCPLMAAIENKTIFAAVGYKFRMASSMEFINAIKAAHDDIVANRSAAVVLQDVRKVYDNYIIENKWWKLEHEPQFYIDLVAPIINSKPYAVMVSEEFDKARRVKDCMDTKTGVKCFTMHSAKGLEANDVYLLDADANIVPNAKRIKDLIKEGCEYEAAQMIREERNLLYVAATRAKDNFYITHYGDLSPLISNPKTNSYCELDEVYSCTRQDYDDVGAFLKLINLQDAVRTSNTATVPAEPNVKTSTGEVDIADL